MKNHELDDLKRQINLYFDNALSQTESEILLQKIHSSPEYHRVFEKEKSFREYIKNNVKRPSVTPELIQSIKESIRVV